MSIETAKLKLGNWMREIGGGFHPDTPFEDYVDVESGVNCYGEFEAREKNEDMDRVFEAFSAAGEDVYGYCLQFIRAQQGS